MFCHLGFDNRTERLGGREGFKSRVESGGSGYVAVPEYAAHKLIVTQPLLQDYRCCGVAELMGGYAKSYLFLDQGSNIGAGMGGRAMFAIVSGKKPITHRLGLNAWAENVDELVD